MEIRNTPNIIFLNIDECKASALNCYGNTDAITPRINELASEGLLFENSFTTFPKCVPARCAWMTGRYPHTDGHRTLPGFEIRKGENNLITEFKKVGYRTGIFGKNHTVEENIFKELFDEFMEMDSENEPFHRPLPAEEKDRKLFKAFYQEGRFQKQGFYDTLNTQGACRFIRENSNRNFFLLMNIESPHPIYMDMAPYIDLVKEKNIKLPIIEKLEEAPAVLNAYRKIYDLEEMNESEWRKVVEAYYSMVSYSDDLVGDIINTIREAGIEENTLLIFTSDHGDFAGEHGAVEKWDTMFYDCLVKVPLILRYPGRIKSGLRTSILTENIDIAPTILDLCGMEIPNWMHGKSLCDVIDGITQTHRKEVFCEGGMEDSALLKSLPYSDAHYVSDSTYFWKQKTMIDYPFTMMRSKMIRTEKWKLIYRVNGIKELYDLEKDPHELQDVSNAFENKDIIIELIERLLLWCIRTETDYPVVDIMHA